MQVAVKLYRRTYFLECLLNETVIIFSDWGCCMWDTMGCGSVTKEGSFSILENMIWTSQVSKNGMLVGATLTSKHQIMKAGGKKAGEL